jgi:hypothetical protein
MLVPQHLHDINPENPRLKAAQRSRLISQETYLLAEHSDSRNTTQLIHNLRPAAYHVRPWLPPISSGFDQFRRITTPLSTPFPAVGTLVELPIGDRFLQPTPRPPVTMREN